MRSFKRTLLAEDDPKEVELTISVLGGHNLANDIMIAYDGVETLDYLYRRERFTQKPSENPVVILLNLKMPRLDGIQVLRQIKSDENLQIIPVVIMASSRESRNLENCYQPGANAYVVKPVKFADFVEAVKGIGVFWALINEPHPDR